MNLQKSVCLTVLVLLLNFSVSQVYAWGFFGHKRINRMAVFTLPPEMITFYKKHIRIITESAVNPDSRRYAVKGEAPRHYIDIDIYGDSALYTMPRRWKDAVAKYTEDTLMAYGVVPWHIELMKHRLTDAFKKRNIELILRLSSEIGHYIGDANVPLHTTHNYNGQYSGQYGIHGFWESRLPELFSDDYDFFMERASYLTDTQNEAWRAVTRANLALDSVFRFERELTDEMGDDKKWTFETRGARTIKVYSYEFSKAYHQRLNGQVERQMRSAIQMIGDFWYTCWVDAGQPNLDEMIGIEVDKEFEKQLEKEREVLAEPLIQARPHASGAEEN
jgi:hypothetical protein